MKKRIVGLSAALVLLAQAAASIPPGTSAGDFELRSTIAFTSTRDAPTAPFRTAAEIYLMNSDGTNPRRITDNAYGDAFPTLSPDGKKIVFDSNRCVLGADGCPAQPQFDNLGNPLLTEPGNTSELFVMDTDGGKQTRVARGSSASWSPNGKAIAFHASASFYESGGVVTALPTRIDPGAATGDSDIFVANFDDLLTGNAQPTNLTNSPDTIDDDANWSADGQKIVFTSHPVTDNARLSNQAELYVMNADGSDVHALTHNNEEERAPAWSPDDSRIVYSCRVGGGMNPFRICVMNADGTDVQQLTDEGDSISDLTATWSPDGEQILYHRQVPPNGQQLFVMNADGTEPIQLSFPPGMNNLASWGELRIKAEAKPAVAPASAHPAPATVPAARSATGSTTGAAGDFQLQQAIAFTSTRDCPNCTAPAEFFTAAEIYLGSPDFTDPNPANWHLTHLQRLTANADAEAFAALSPDGRKIVFDSNRNRLEGESLNTSDLFVMDTDGSEQSFLTRGSSAAWSPGSKEIAFHASASGAGTPLRTDPGSATSDSDIFIANVDGLLEGAEAPTNITRAWTESNGERIRIADDPDWSPDGQHIVFTAHDAGDDGPNWPLPPFISNSGEIYVLDAPFTGMPRRLTYTSVPDDGLPDEEERAPDWSPDGERIELMCRIGGGTSDFELCVMDADGSNRVQLTDNTVADLSANWSPDGEQLVFHRPVAGPFQLFVINSTLNPNGTRPAPVRVTSPPGLNGFPDWGFVRTKAVARHQP
jgi:TolB protein